MKKGIKWKFFPVSTSGTGIAIIINRKINSQEEIMTVKIFPGLLILSLLITGWSLERQEPIRETIDANQQMNRERLRELQELGSRVLSALPSDACVDKLMIRERIDRINQDIEKMLAQTLITDAGVKLIQTRVNELEREIQGVRKIDTRFRRIEKRVDEVSDLIQDLEGQQFQKMEIILNRVSELLQKAREKRQNCEILAAGRIIEQIEAIGKKTRKEIRNKLADGKRLQKYIRRNAVILEKIEGRLQDNDRTAYEIAKDLHEKSKTAISGKEYKKAWRAAIACREHLFDLGRDVLNPEEIEAVKNRVKALIKRTVKAVEKAEEIAAKADNPDITGFVQSAREDLRKAENLHQKGQDAKAMIRLRAAQRIAEKIIKSASRVKNVSMILERLEKRYEKVGRMIKDNDDQQVTQAYENAGKHFEKAKALAQNGKNEEAAREAQLAVRLLGKVVHLGVKDDPNVAQELKEELKRVREKVVSNLEQLKDSDNEAARALGKKALQQLSKAKALIAEKQYKRALQHLFKASSFSERAVHVMNNRSNPELEEDTDLEEDSSSEE